MSEYSFECWNCGVEVQRDWDEVEEQTQQQQVQEKTNGKTKKKRETNNDKKIRDNIKSISR